MANTSGRRVGVPWRRDPVIIRRLPEVERRHLAGQSNIAIADALNLTEGSVRKDLDRLRELWLERAGDKVEILRAQAVAALEDIRRRAIAAAEFDEAAERAVLFGEIPEDADWIVQRDEKGSVQFRGNKAGALQAARQATMDEAKLLGLVVEKQEHSGEMLLRQYEGVDVGKV